MTDKPTDAPSKERLDRLEDDIEKERARAQREVPSLTDNPKGQEFYESGATPEEDDQTIAPG